MMSSWGSGSKISKLQQVGDFCFFQSKSSLLKHSYKVFTDGVDGYLEHFFFSIVAPQLSLSIKKIENYTQKKEKEKT